MKNKSSQGQTDALIHRPQTTSSLKNSKAKTTFSPKNNTFYQTSRNQECQETISLKHDFNMYMEASTEFVSHNGTISSFREQLSQQVIYFVRCFNIFIRQADIEIGSFGANKSLSKTQQIGNRSPIFNYAKDLKTLWNKFAITIESISYTGPEIIQEKIHDLFDILHMVINQIYSNCSDSHNIHNPTLKLCETYDTQLKSLESAIMNFAQIVLSNPHTTNSSNQSDFTNNSPRVMDETNQVSNEVRFYTDLDDSEQYKTNPVKNLSKSIEDDMKKFSRQLNESFSKDFVSTLPVNKLNDLKVHAFASCSDIIHEIKALYLFQSDIRKVFDSYDSFHDSLLSLFTTLNLDSSNFPSKHGVKRFDQIQQEINEITEQERMFHFNEDSSLNELFQQGFDNKDKFGGDSEFLEEFFSILKKKIDENKNEIDMQKKQNQIKEKEIEQLKNSMKEQLELEKETNLTLSEEIKKLKETLIDRERQISSLQHKEDDNEFKKCLKNVARKLGGVLKEEALSFGDGTDDQLISYVNALSVYIVEKKCQKCVVHDKLEKEVGEYLKQINQNEDDQDILKAVKSAKSLFDSLRSEITEKENEIIKFKEDLENSKKKLAEFFKKFGANEISPNGINSLDEFAEYILNSTKDLEIKHDEDIKSIKSNQEFEINKLIENIGTKLKPIFPAFDQLMSQKSDQSQEETLLQIIQSISDRLLNAQKNIKSKEEIEKIVCSRLGKNLNINNPLEIGPTIEKSIMEELNILESFKNPLVKVVSELEQQKSQAYSTILIIGNRLRGIANLPFDNDISSMTEKELSTHVISTLGDVQDILETLKTQLDQYQKEGKRMRTCLETLDLRMHVFLQQENLDLNTLSINQLIDRVLLFVDKITKPITSNYFVPITKLNDMFVPIFKIFPTTTQSDPSHYINEISAAFINMNDSIQTLKPFNEILINIFNNSKLDYQSFQQNNESFHFLQESLMKLHSELNKIPGGKVNKTIFINISKTIMLLSSLLNVISSKKFTEEKDSEKIYQMLQENSRMKDIIEQNRYCYRNEA